MATSKEVLATTNSLSYRQLDYWTRRGYLRTRNPHGKRGSGYPHEYSDDELDVAVRMARLIDRGFTAKAAARIARQTPGEVYLGQGITLILKDPGRPQPQNVAT
jgi:DNA-binding transcriptional MerR regulator